jgi:DNA-binding XRE family transcriptional regulator
MLNSDKDQQHQETMLRQIRQNVFDMKQDEFSVWLGVTQGTISRCENGKTEMVLTSRQWHRLFSKLENKLGIPILQRDPIDLSSRSSIEQWLKKN